MAINDPTQPSIADALLPIVAPIVQQAVSAAAADTQARLTALEGQLTPGILTAGTAVLSNVTHDQWLQRAMSLVLLGAVLAGCLIVLVGYMTGNAQAGRIIAGVPATIGALYLLYSRFEGVTLPRPAPKA